MDTEYVVINRAPKGTDSAIAHLPHPTRGDGTLCGWVGILPWGWAHTPARICAACQSKAQAR
jgi:hypothetical protein